VATYPITILVNGCRFEIFGVDEYESRSQGDQVVNVVLGDYRGRYSDLKLPTRFLLQIADTIYRVANQQPRDQTVRVELVAPAPAAPVATWAAPPEPPRLRLVDDAGEDIEAIKRGLLR